MQPFCTCVKPIQLKFGVALYYILVRRSCRLPDKMNIVWTEPGKALQMLTSNSNYKKSKH